MRTQRTETYTQASYQYIYNGSSLSQMTVGDNTMYFAYDAQGLPQAVTYNGTTYFYLVNLQGDVIGILDSNENLVVSYTYDAWGNPLTLTGSMASTLGTLNPLRYRGYVYDNETGLYYLQSRYYNPEYGRFINADSQLNINSLLGYNLFAYCENNPVNLGDFSGSVPKELPFFAMCLDGGGGFRSASGISAGTIVTSAAVAAVVAKRQVLKEKSYTIYTLTNSVSEEVVYVGRTTDFDKRMAAHKLNPARKELVPEVLHTNLSYEKARAAEQLYIILYSTLDKSNKAKNQINGVNPKRRDYLEIMRNGFGLNEALDSILTNRFLLIFE